MAQDHVDVLGHLLDFGLPLHLAGLRFVAEIEPRLDAGQERLEPVALQADHVRLRQERQAALGDEINAPGRGRRFDRVQELVEPDPEIGIVPADARPAQLPPQEPQVVLDHLQVERLVRDDRVDAEAAGVGAAEAAEHRHDLEERGFAQRRLDELPALPYPGECRRLAGGRAVHAQRPVAGAIL